MVTMRPGVLFIPGIPRRFDIARCPTLFYLPCHELCFAESFGTIEVELSLGEGLGTAFTFQPDLCSILCHTVLFQKSPKLLPAGRPLDDNESPHIVLLMLHCRYSICVQGRRKERFGKEWPAFNSRHDTGSTIGRSKGFSCETGRCERTTNYRQVLHK